MSKIKIYELAKELDIPSKELVKFLGDKHIEAKSHMSSIEETEANMVRNHFQSGESSVKAEKVKTEQPETEKPEDTAEAKKVSEAPKKKSIVHVFRPQNSKSGGGRQKRGAAQGKIPHPGKPMQVNNGRLQKEAVKEEPAPRQGMKKPEDVKEEAEKPAEEIKINQTTEKEAAVAKGMREETKPVKKEQTEKHISGEGNILKNDRPQKEQFSKPERNGGDRPRGDRPQGDRFSRSDRPQSDRFPRSDRPQGDRFPRNDRSQGDRSQNDRFQRNDRPQGDRPHNDRFPRSDRPQGDRFQRNDRPQGDRSQGGRFQGGDRPQGSRYGLGGEKKDWNQRKPADRRGDKKVSDPLSYVVEGQKPQRSKGKGKEDFKKKDYRKDEDNRQKKGKKTPETKPLIQKPRSKVQKAEEQIKSIILPEVLTIKELADKMKIVPSVIVKKLFLKGQIVTVNQEINYETAEEIALEFDVLCEKEEVVDVIEELLREEDESEDTMTKRPPVVCVMGHVDHGKTSLLDAIRDTNVIDKEAGGITQHIGAYVVDVNGEKITFLDTPGHEVFTAMRMRGASSTDIAILVVAADDGVMPQTVEAINHAKAAGVEIVVAVNKIDKPSANIDRVKQELAEYELIPEDWGGSTIFVPVSAKTREGLDDLMEMLLLTAEVLELKANPNRKARGLVLEAELDKGRGSVATILVQKGTLRVGDPIAAGAAYGKVRAMMDDKGRRVKEAGPSMPVEILGLNDVPNAGEVFVNCENDKEARSFAETFISQSKVKLLEDTKAKLSLDDLFTQIKEGNLKELGIVIKADVQGSVEAMKQSLLKLSNDEVVVKVIHGGVGAINESDVSLASASNAIIIGFNVRPDAAAKETADREGVDLRMYRVIYKAIEDVEAAMKGMLDPVFEEKVLGHAEVRQIFKASGVGTIAGSYVLDGTFERDCSVRITRDDTVIFEGKLASLKRFKDDVKEVRTGYECGLVFENFNDVQEEDRVEAYKMVEVPR